MALGPKFKISSPALFPYGQLPVRHWISETPQAQSKPRHFVLTAVSSFLLRFHKPSRHSSSNLSWGPFYFSPTFVCHALKAFHSAVCLSIFSTFPFPLLTPRLIFGFAIGSLTRFLTPPSIPLSFAMHHHHRMFRMLGTLKTQNQIQGCPVLTCQKYIKKFFRAFRTSMKKIKSYISSHEQTHYLSNLPLFSTPVAFSPPS